MSSTRHAPENASFRQERFCSSEAYDKALLGNLVAKRAKLIDSPENRALVYFLQQESNREGGLERVAKELAAMFPERLRTRAMMKMGTKPDGNYSKEQVKIIRRDFPDGEERFPLHGEPKEDIFAMLMDSPNTRREQERERATCLEYPKSYPVADFIEACRQQAHNLGDHLRRLCVDPEINLTPTKIDPQDFDLTNYERTGEVRFFDRLIDALHTYRRAKITAAEKAIAKTEVSRQIADTLEFALQERTLVVIEGLERLGKSHTAKNFCDQHPGHAVYVSLESGHDEATFFRAIAKALGVSCAANRKAVEMRMRIEDMLQEGHLMLVIDEAHFLWPQVQRIKCLPGRMDWLRTALVDHGVPVALISTPQFDRQCAIYEKHLLWNSRQLKGRVGQHLCLPDGLAESDLQAIVLHKWPEADKASLLALVGIANLTANYVAAIERVLKRARFRASQAGRAKPAQQDIFAAIDEIVPPAKEAAAHDLPTSEHKPCKMRATAHARPLQGSSDPVAHNRLRTTTRPITPLHAEVLAAG